jgi:hypothetical protein
MIDPVGSDPELDFAELCLDAADRAEACFEHWSQMADEAPTARLRALYARLAAEEVVFANESRKCADDLLYDYDYDDGA